ncbi:hypothetical protein LEJE111609_16960 [Lelliottia jeotgali]
MAASGIREGCTEKSRNNRPVALRLPGLQGHHAFVGREVLGWAV